MWDEDIISDQRNANDNAINIDSQKKQVLVIDTNAFIKCLDLQALNDKYQLITTPQVLYEIKDKKARDKFHALPFTLETKEPSKTALSAVRKFATATGDIASLSAVDLQVIALCYTYSEINGTTSQLRKDPPEIKEAFPMKVEGESGIEQVTLAEQAAEEKSEPSQQTENTEAKIDEENVDKKETIEDEWNVVPAKQKKIHVKKTRNDHGWNFEEKSNESKKEANTVVNQKEDIIPIVNPKREAVEIQQQTEQVEVEQKQTNEIKENSDAPKPKQEIESEYEEDDDGTGWINSDNIHLYQQQGTQKAKETTQNIGVSILTADFAMQNVSLQMGIPLVSLDGMMITRAKRFILECFSCLKLEKDMTKLFCSKCGNYSLLKVSCSVQSNGEIKLYRKKGFKIDTTGFIYSIPKPKDGKRSNNLVLKEDELLQGNRLTQMKIAKKQQEKEFNRNMLEFENGFTLGDVKHKQPIHSSIKLGYGGQNPNQVAQTKRHKRK